MKALAALEWPRMEESVSRERSRSRTATYFSRGDEEPGKKVFILEIGRSREASWAVIPSWQSRNPPYNSIGCMALASFSRFLFIRVLPYRSFPLPVPFFLFFVSSNRRIAFALLAVFFEPSRVHFWLFYSGKWRTIASQTRLVSYTSGWQAFFARLRSFFCYWRGRYILSYPSFLLLGG